MRLQLILVLPLITSVLLIRGSAAQIQDPPNFHTAINYVEIAVRVQDSGNRFVPDLTARDFLVYEDGKLQTLASFDIVRIAALPGGSGQSADLTPLTASRLQSLRGRMYTLMVDDYHLHPQYAYKTRGILQDFVKARMMEGDAAAVVFTSGLRGQDFTMNRALVSSALARVRGTFDYDETAGVREMKAYAVMRMIQDLSASLGEIKHRRKALILVTPFVGCAVGRQAPREFDLMTGSEEVRSRDYSSEGNGRAAPSNLDAMICNTQIFDAIRTAQAADVTVYAVDPRGLRNPAWVPPTIDGRGGPGRALQKAETIEGTSGSIGDAMFPIAQATGGFVVSGTNGFSKGFERIVAETGSYYLLSYYSTNAVSDGSLRKNEIKVSREGVRASYRPNYLAPDGWR